MEKVLYEYGFDLSEYLLNLIPLIVGIGFFATLISIIKAKKRGEDVRGFHPAFFKVVGFIVGPLGVLLFLISTLGMAVEHIEYKELLETNRVCYVEGYVENFHPMPYEGHDTTRSYTRKSRISRRGLPLHTVIGGWSSKPITLSAV